MGTERASTFSPVEVTPCKGCIKQIMRMLLLPMNMNITQKGRLQSISLIIPCLTGKEFGYLDSER